MGNRRGTQELQPPWYQFCYRGLAGGLGWAIRNEPGGLAASPGRKAPLTETPAGAGTRSYWGQACLTGTCQHPSCPRGRLGTDEPTKCPVLPKQVGFSVPSLLTQENPHTPHHPYGAQGLVGGPNADMLMPPCCEGYTGRSMGIMERPTGFTFWEAGKEVLDVSWRRPRPHTNPRAWL